MPATDTNPAHWASIIPTVATTLATCAVAAVVAWVVARRGRRLQALTALQSRLGELNSIAITYPELEDDDFCAAWPSALPRSKEYLRYDTYCCQVFNLLESAFQHFGQNPQRLENFIGSRELIRRHGAWWRSPEVRAKNAEGYSDPLFWKYVESQLD